MIRVKASVLPKSLVILAAVANAAHAREIDVTVTSGNDSRHMDGSRHYQDRALDVRSKAPFTTLADKRQFLAEVLARLGPDYQGLLEAAGTPNEHFHIEHDPKPPLDTGTRLA